MYVTLARRIWTGGLKPFLLLYMVMCWNLMSRSRNVTDILLNQLDVKGDAITILFSVTKTNQSGDNIHPRHVYANPLKPEICPVLALGVYLLTTNFSKSKHLFEGNSQYTRFSDGFRKFLRKNAEFFAQWGNSVDELGTHSFRKGAATFACSGSTHGAHISAVCVRCGWRQPGVQDTYLHFADAGDQLVGRIVAGLPVDCVHFATLPPHFTEHNAEIERAVNLAFPTLIGKIKMSVLLMCLASLVHHHKFVLENGGSKVQGTFLFADKDEIAKLSKYVRSGLPTADGDLKATGIPPHVGLMREFAEQRDGLIGVRDKISDVVQAVEATGKR